MKSIKFTNSALKTIDIQAKEILGLKTQIDKNFDQLCQSIVSLKGKVILMGVGKSGHIAQKVSATLASTGSPSFFIHPTEAAHGDLGMMSKDDGVIIFSNSGETKEITQIMPSLKRSVGSIFAITNSNDSTIAKASTSSLQIKVSKEACPHNLAPTSSTTAFMVIGDAIAIALLESKNFSKEDFAKSHPAGSLGKKLTTYVKDLAINNTDVPIVSKDTSLKQTILEVSSKKLGMTLVGNKKNIQGIFTDGDLRRALNEGCDLENTLVETVMTKSFVAIDENKLAIDAANLMETNKIFTLVVTSKSKNYDCSIITMHSLLEAGIV
tara:strand:- start:13300 stop:14271 length:972 start_codon:yes stop_codon:yes gene_type:complete